MRTVCYFVLLSALFMGGNYLLNGGDMKCIVNYLYMNQQQQTTRSAQGKSVGCILQQDDQSTPRSPSSFKPKVREGGVGS